MHWDEIVNKLLVSQNKWNRHRLGQDLQKASSIVFQTWQSRTLTYNHRSTAFHLATTLLVIGFNLYSCTVGIAILIFLEFVFGKETASC
jgi:hypothetical protein